MAVSLSAAATAPAVLATDLVGPAALAAGVVDGADLSEATPTMGGFYPDSPMAYPDFAYPDMSELELTTHTPTPAVLTAA